MKRAFLLIAAAALAVLAANWISAGRETPPAAAQPPTDPMRLVYPEQAQPDIVLPDGRHERLRSLLTVNRRMHFGEFVWNENNVPPGPAWVRVDLAAQTISVFRAGQEIGTAVILYGTDGYPTPHGLFHVLEKDRDHWSRTYDAPMTYMLRLTDDGVAIHASNVAKGFATHGCVGVPIAFAHHLFDNMNKGDPVLIVAKTGRKTAANAQKADNG